MELNMNIPARSATLRLNSKDKPTLLRVELPPKITKAELAKLTTHIVDDIIHPHTGCTCLSGTIAVVFDNNVLREAVTVSLG
jgi:hypothetical protein